MGEILDNQYIVYELGNERYAINISEVYEIIKMPKITPIYNNSKPFLEGVINIRGIIVPVINFHKRFGFNNYSKTKFTRVVVVKTRDEMISVIVDKIVKVMKFSDIQSASEMVAGIDGSYFDGIGVTEEGVISILNIDKVLYE